MDPLRFFRRVMSFGHVLFSILRVFCAMGAVLLLLSILVLSFMPAGLVTLDLSADTKVSVNMRAIAGDEWDSLDDQARDQLQDALPDGELTEDGFEMRASAQSNTVENRGLAIAVIPAFVSCIITFFLARFLGRAMKMAKDAPFHREVAGHLRNAGWVLIAMGCIPALCSSLIHLLTRTTLAQGSLNLYEIFGGFVLWALADLILFIGPRISTAPESQPEGIHPDAF